MIVSSLIEEDVEPVSQYSPSLQYTLYLNHKYLLTNPMVGPQEDMHGMQTKYNYEVGNCLMMRSEHEFHRWIYVKVVKALAWHLLGRYVPIYAVSFANGEVQCCEEEELWPLTEVLQISKRARSKSAASPQKATRRLRYDRPSEGTTNSSEKILNTDESQCQCAEDQCIHLNKYASGRGDVVDEIF